VPHLLSSGERLELAKAARAAKPAKHG
jgi:hypothetical protein